MTRARNLAALAGAWLAIGATAQAICVDLDSDGVCDTADACPNTSSGAVVDASGCPLPVFGDFNHDGDVDKDDLATMQACWSGPAVPASATPACQAARFDADADVDMVDFAAFQRCFSGADNPASPNCRAPDAFIAAGRLYIIGSSASESLALRLKSGLPNILEIDFGDDGYAEYNFDRASFDHIVVGMGGGNDQVRIDQINGVFTDTEITSVNGGDGDDTLLGGSGNELFLGGNGHDTIRGGLGIDTALMGAGDDTFIWNPGDGSDVVEGQGGDDALLFNGSNAAEVFDVSANGSRVRVIRSVGAVLMDLNGVERIDLNALGGADAFTLRDLAGTDANRINVKLSGAFSGSIGDDQVDTVTVLGTDLGDNLTIANNGAIVSMTGLAAVVNITGTDPGLDQLVVNGLDGDDSIKADGLAAGLVVLTVNGGIGEDHIVGSAGADFLNGDEDNDLILGGPGSDTVQMGVGNDTFEWRPGDDTDLVEGADGNDTVEVDGSDDGEAFTVTANGTRVRFDRISPAPFFLDIGTCENLLLRANSGNDTLNCTGNLAALIAITADGGPGNDALNGSNGADVLLGGEDDDTIDGNQGNDVALMGAGNDTFNWDPGDGSDTVEGQAGNDVLRFNGANIAEVFDFSANGNRLRFTRNIGSVVMDVNDVERVDVNALGGADAVTVNSLGGTDVTQVNLNLASSVGGGDAAADNVAVNGTNAADAIAVTASGATAVVNGLGSAVSVSGAEPGIDRLTLNALGGADTVNAANLPAGIIDLTVNGGDGNDQLVGSAGADSLNGEGDNDTLLGGPGDDTILGGIGNDRAVWQPGDGSDLIEGGDGSDTVEVNGGNGAENFTITANGTRVRFDRISPAPFFLDIGTSESLVLNANGGDDTLNCTGNLAALIAITADGGPGNDTLNGSNGADVLIGGDDNDTIDGNQGNDVALMGSGNDTFNWDPGDGSDIVEGQGGNDVLRFNGANIAEIIDISANGGRVRMTRNIGSIVMDVNGVERIDYNAVGGADAVTVHDLAGTDAAEVHVDLASPIGSGTGDGSSDTVTVNGTNADDVINIAGSAGSVSVTGLSASVFISGAEATLDRLIVNALGGDDTVSASGLTITGMLLTIDGGPQNDVIIGGDGPDTLLGGDGDDIIFGGPGLDVIDGGPGSNIIIPN